MKKILAFVLFACLLCPLLLVEGVAAETPFDVEASSAVLMEATTGEILYAKNEDKALPPASVTKVMTLLLVMEAVKEGRVHWEDTVTVSERAASMGGSQIYLKVGESMSLSDMVKSVVIASANDAAVALAEHVAGSEEAFVAMMNDRAAALGMKNTHFENTNGLDDTAQNHLISAKDIAIMSRALIAYPEILEYSSTWMDTVRDGAFTLTNTNRLVRFYPGATGLKTGSTSKAGFCISATAERDGVSLIAVIMGASTRDVRNAQAKKLLDYGFSTYGVYSDPARELHPIPVSGGTADVLSLQALPFSAVLPKGKVGAVTATVEVPERIAAPVAKGEQVGRVIYMLEGKKIGESAVLAETDVSRISFIELFRRLMAACAFS